MKTISEYQPLLFSTLERLPAQREQRRKRTVSIFRYVLPVVYALAAMKVTADTALLPWDLGFWMILAPLVAFSEYAIACWRDA